MSIFSLAPPSHWCSANTGGCDHRSHHRGGAGPAGAHRGHLLPDEVPGGPPCLQPQRQVSGQAVGSVVLPFGPVPGTAAQGRANPWHWHLRGQAAVAAVSWFDITKRSVCVFGGNLELERRSGDNDNDLPFGSHPEKLSPSQRWKNRAEETSGCEVPLPRFASCYYNKHARDQTRKQNTNCDLFPRVRWKNSFFLSSLIDNHPSNRESATFLILRPDVPLTLK